VLVERLMLAGRVITRCSRDRIYGLAVYEKGMMKDYHG